MDMDIVLCTTEINVLKQVAADKNVLNKDNFIDYIMASSDEMKFRETCWFV